MLRSLQSIPDFVWRDPTRSGLPFGLPVVVVQPLPAAAFEEQLVHLRAAGYESLSADEIVAILQGSMPAPARGIALTFDGGAHSAWTVVAPLLRRHGFRGIAFVTPRLLADGPPRPTLDDALEGTTDREACHHDAEVARLRWSEVERLAAGRTLEIQSHTWDDARVFTSPEIIDFQHPGSDGRPRYPWLWSAIGGEPNEPAWGAPVYPSASRMAARRYYDDPTLRDACQQFVAVRGGAGYLRDETWRVELARFARTYRGQGDGGHLEDPGAADVDRLASLRKSQEALRERLGRPVEHVALPGSHGVPHAPRLIREAGYRSGFTRAAPSGRLRPGDDPFDLSRVQGRWLESLPGPGRVDLASRVASRARRLLA